MPASEMSTCKIASPGWSVLGCSRLVLVAPLLLTVPLSVSAAPIHILLAAFSLSHVLFSFPPLSNSRHENLVSNLKCVMAAECCLLVHSHVPTALAACHLAKEHFCLAVAWSILLFLFLILSLCSWTSIRASSNSAVLQTEELNTYILLFLLVLKLLPV